MLISPIDGTVIRYREYSGDGTSQTEAFENVQFSANRVFDIQSIGADGSPVKDAATPRLRYGWDQRWNFIRSVFGYPLVKTIVDPLGDPVWTFIDRTDPMAYPIRTIGGKSLLYPQDVTRVRGLGAWRVKNGTGYYDEARVDIRFGSRPYSVQSNYHAVRDFDGHKLVDESTLTRYVEKRWSFVTQALTLPRGGAVWEGTQVPVDDSNIRIVSHIEMVYVWYQVPGIPAAVKTHLGCVNDSNFDGHPAETMLLSGVELRPYRWVTGQRLYDILYKFRFFNPEGVKGHNHFLHYKGASVAPAYDRILTPGTPPGGASGTEGIFKLKDMRELFRPPLIDLVSDW